MTRAHIFLMLCLASHPSCAQTVTSPGSSSQGWSGGVAGRSGCRYNFEIDFTDFPTDPQPDTLWIGSEPFPLTISDSAGYRYNTHRTRFGHTIRFQVHAETERNEDYGAPPFEREKGPSYHAPVSYGGVALLSYKYLGTEHYYEIKKVASMLPGISYP